MKAHSAERCVCGSGAAYDACCGRWHAGQPAPTAEAVMRSRYTAFVIHDESYLRETWHRSRRPERIEFDPAQKWLGLKIVSSASTGSDTAEVEFIARYRLGGASAARLHERSRFVLENGRWLYVDGDLL